MKRAPLRCRVLRLEPLEARALFAGGLVGGDPNNSAEIQSAITGEGDFSLLFSSYSDDVTVTGRPGSRLVIDFDRLPDSVTNLTISSFAEVQFLGTDKLSQLTVNDTNTLVGANITVRDLVAVDVGTLELAATTGIIASLKGSETNLKVRSLDQTMLISDLDTLTISSESEMLLIILTRSDQQIRLNYQPKQIDVVGLANANQIVLPIVDDGGGTNGGDDGDGGTQGPGTGTPGTEIPGAGEPTTEPPVKIVIHLADAERVRSLILQLEQYLTNGDADRAEVLASVLSINNPVWSGPSSAGTDSTAAREPEANHSRAPETHDEVDQDTAIQNDSSLPTLGDLELSSLQGDLDRPTDLIRWPVVDAGVEPKFVALSGPGTRHGSPADDAAAGATPTIDAGEADAGLRVVALDDDRLSFGEYLLDRVAAEFTPGNQSAVLLTDPRPGRSAADGSRKAVFDLLG